MFHRFVPETESAFWGSHPQALMTWSHNELASREKSQALSTKRLLSIRKPTICKQLKCKNGCIQCNKNIQFSSILTLKLAELNPFGSLCLLSDCRNRLWSVTYLPSCVLSAVTGYCRLLADATLW